MSWTLELPSLKAFYEMPLDSRAREWRRIGAVAKADNVLAAISDAGQSAPIKSILEVGAGTGAILDILADKCPGKKLTGLEIGDDRQNSLGAEQGYEMCYFKGGRLPFPDDAFDFVHASHVLEHVVDERAFLLELRRVSKRWIYVEVPCELTVRTSAASLQASLNIGHINAFTPESLALRMQTSGCKLKTIKITDIRFDSIKFNRSIAVAAIVFFIRRVFFIINPRFAARLFVFHVWSLSETGQLLDI